MITLVGLQKKFLKKSYVLKSNVGTEFFLRTRPASERVVEEAHELWRNQKLQMVS
jgi:hypothetical protein